MIYRYSEKLKFFSIHPKWSFFFFKKKLLICSFNREVHVNNQHIVRETRKSHCVLPVSEILYNVSLVDPILIIKAANYLSPVLTKADFAIICWRAALTLQAPIPQNGQTYSNKSSPTNCLSVFDHIVGLALKGLTHFRPMYHFYTSWISRKPNVFWYFWGV